MIGHYLGEFSLSYTPVRHTKPGVTGKAGGAGFLPIK
jgi:small subunit ribosomal protein S15e